MIRNIIKIIKIFGHFRKNSFFFLLFIVILGLSFMEFVGIAMIIPAIIVMTKENGDNFFNESIVYLHQFIPSIDQLDLFILIFLFFSIFKYLYSTFAIYFLYNNSFSFVKDFNIFFLKNYLNKSFVDHLNEHSSDIIRKLTIDSQAFAGNGILGLLAMVTEMTIVLSITFFLLIINLKLSLLLLLFILILVFAYVFYTKSKTNKYAKNRLLNDQLKLKLLQNTAYTIAEIKISRTENKILQKYEMYDSNSIEALKFQTTLLDSIKYAIEVFGIAALLLAIYLSKGIINLDNLVVTMGTYIFAAFKILPSVNRLIAAYQRVQFSKAMTDEFYSIVFQSDMDFRIKTKSHAHAEIPKDNLRILNFKEFIQFDQVSHSYDPSNTILDKINLKIKKGSKVGIVGETGSGKTTLLNILLGLITPTKGKVLIDDINLADNIYAWQKKIGYCPQNAGILDDTILENIIFNSNKNFSHNHVNDILKITLCFDFMIKNKYTLMTPVGEMGARLSGGQKQRIGIARSLINNPEIIVFDESTSSLDVDTEKKLLDNIFQYLDKNQDKTFFFISHKSHLLERCDIIYDVKNNKLIKN